MQFVKRIALIMPVVALFLVSCAAPRAKTPDIGEAEVKQEQKRQRMLVIESNIQDQARLMDVMYDIIKRTTSFCENRAMFSGFFFVAKGFYKDEEYREAAVELFDLRDHPKVAHVVPHSPAEKAGMREGDEIVLVEGKLVPNKPEEMKEMIESLPRSRGSISMTVNRDGTPISIEIEQLVCCNYGVQLVPKEQINAATDGERIYVTKGLLRFVRNDTELAAIISHEMAHCVRGHVEMRRANQFAGGFVGLLLDVASVIVGVGGPFPGFYDIGWDIGKLAYSKSMEREADYVSLYIMAVAGYDYNAAPNFYRRLASADPKSIEKSFARTHPSSPERFIAMEKAVKEINDKKSKGLPFIPEEKPVPAPDTVSPDEEEF